MIVILHNIRSIHNIGSIFRTADASGVKKIYLTGITATPVDRLGKPRQQLTKVSLGAEKTIPWEYIKSGVVLMKKLKKESYKIFTIEQSEKSIPYYLLKNQDKNMDKIVLVVGNEVRGLPDSILKLSDKILEIPMAGKKESLNVSVAFGIIAFHFISKKDNN